MSDKVQLLGIETRRASYVSREQYDRIVECILSSIDEKENGIIALSDLIERTYQKLAPPFRGDIPWHLLHIKQDLQARGAIKMFFDIHKKQFIVRIHPRKHKASNP